MYSKRCYQYRCNFHNFIIHLYSNIQSISISNPFLFFHTPFLRQAVGGLVFGYGVYRVGHFIFARRPEDIIMTADGPFYVGYSNAEGPPPTHNRKKVMPELIPPYRDHQKELEEMFMYVRWHKRNHFRWPEDMPFKGADS